MVHVLFLIPNAAVVDLNIDEVGHQNGDKTDNQTDDHHDAQIKTKDIGGSQRVGRGRHHAVSGGGADGQAAGDIAHLHIDLGGNGDADGDQDNEGDIKEHRDGQHEASQTQAPDGALLGERGNQLVGDDVGSAAVTHQLAQDGAEADRQADAGHHAAEAGGDGVHCSHQVEAAGHTHEQTGQNHADGSVEFEDDDAEQDNCDCDHQCYDQHCGRYHRVSSFLFLCFLHYYLKPELSGGPPVHGRPPAARIFQNRLPFSSKGRS